METKMLALLGLVLFGLATESSAHFWGRAPHYTMAYPNYSVQNKRYQQYLPQKQQELSVANAEWVCKNTKTEDMMIIVSENVPQTSGVGQWQKYLQQQPNYPQAQPNIPQIQPNYPQAQPILPQNRPNYPQTQPNYPQTQPNSPSYPETSKPTQAPPNTNGEGVIDIRMGE